jgi:hypothetical protein
MPCWREFKELEIVVLRHELAVVRRQICHPRLDERDRMFLAAASRLLGRASRPTAHHHGRRPSPDAAAVDTRDQQGG